MTNRSRMPLILLIVGDSLLLFLSLNLSYAIRSAIGRATGESLFAFAARHPLLLSSIAGIYVFSFYVFDLYNVKKRFFWPQFRHACLGAIFLSTILIILQFWFLPYRFGRGVFFFNLVIFMAAFIPWRVFVLSWFLRAISPESILIVGSAEEGRILRSLADKVPGYRICGFILSDPDGQAEELRLLRLKIEKALADRPLDLMVISWNLISMRGLGEILLGARTKGVPIIDFPAFYEHLTGKIPLLQINRDWLHLYAKFFKPRSLLYEKISRCLDFILALFFLALSLPLSAIAAALVKSTSKGPVLFIQERLGKNKRVFSLWKFRTMVIQAEKDIPRWASPDDARVTKVGRFLRLTRLDEIPQLVNVLRGDMSIIGPRPERDFFVRRLEEKIPYYAFRFFVKPGLTGWAQVNYPYGSSIEDAREKLMYELYYIKNQSLWLDLKIMAKTLKVIILRAGR